ncbi:hypothetical protein ACOME3_006998 [Neoechinorhynchus agilis]
MPSKIKWWLLDQTLYREENKKQVISILNHDIEVTNGWWIKSAEEIHRIGRETLGITTDRKGPKQETWWWNDELQRAIADKESAKKENATKRAKKAVGIGKQEVNSIFYSKQEGS